METTLHHTAAARATNFERMVIMRKLDNDDDDDTQVYKRPWVGLTDEELAELSASGLALWDLWRAIEAKLKEKNT